MQAIYLIGFMGAGKTSVSKELAARFSLDWYDTDDEIVKAAGKSINAIFAQDGEGHFRSIETKVIQRMPTENAVIATGGGAILREENRRSMKEKGVVIFLYADIEEILRRLADDSTRPLLRNNKQEGARSLYAERLSLYRECAHLEIDTAGKSVAEISEEIIQRMKK